MRVDCADRERVFRDGTAEEWLGLERHAETCSACAEEIRVWKALSVAAEQLRDHREDPALWARIEASLIEQRARGIARPTLWEKLSSWRGIPPVWQCERRCRGKATAEEFDIGSSGAHRK